MNYSLHYERRIPMEGTDYKNFHFRADILGTGERITVSCRDLRADGKFIGYHPSLQHIVDNPNPQFNYVEVGAGLGQFIPAISRIHPKIIDPFNYELALDIMLFALPRIKKRSHKRQLEELIRRNRIILSSDVVLINKTIGAAVTDHPELLESFDVLVDNFGPALIWYDTEGATYPQPVLDLESSLLKEKGVLYLNSQTKPLHKRNGKLVGPQPYRLREDLFR